MTLEEKSKRFSQYSCFKNYFNENKSWNSRVLSMNVLQYQLLNMYTIVFSYFIDRINTRLTEHLKGRFICMFIVIMTGVLMFSTVFSCLIVTTFWTPFLTKFWVRPSAFDSSTTFYDILLLCSYIMVISQIENKSFCENTLYNEATLVIIYVFFFLFKHTAGSLSSLLHLDQ